MVRKRPTLQHKISLNIQRCNLCCGSTTASSYVLFRAHGKVSGAVLEDGVGISVAHYCDAHQMCGGWEGRLYTVEQCTHRHVLHHALML